MLRHLRVRRRLTVSANLGLNKKTKCKLYSTKPLCSNESYNFLLGVLLGAAGRQSFKMLFDDNGS